MTGTASPGTDGPSFAPPQLPAGWIAQWDSASRKYYYVQLATGVSQWEVPTEAVQTGNTPCQSRDHPYGTPQPELITHPDGSQTVKHSDGTMEPIMPDGSRGVDGPSGDRGLGTMAVNALLGRRHSSHDVGSSGSHGGPAGDLVALGSQFLGGGQHGGHQTAQQAGPGGNSGGGGGSSAGHLVEQLAANLLSGPDKPAGPQNYSGGPTQGQHVHQGGLAGAVMGGLAHMVGGRPGHEQNDQDYGYSHSGTGGSYSGDAPTYHPPGSDPTHGHPPSGNAFNSASLNQQQPSYPHAHQGSPGNGSYPHPPAPGPGHQGHTFVQPPHGQAYPGTPAMQGGMQPGGGSYGQETLNYGPPPQQHQPYPPGPGDYGAYGGQSPYGGQQPYPGHSSHGHGAYGSHY